LTLAKRAQPLPRRHLSTADDVKRQLSADYPENTLGWISNQDWSGPKEIPLSNVNFTNRKKWNAWHEPQRVAKFARRIAKRSKQGRRIKPVVLVDTPDSDKNRDLMIVDGHHRSLAYQKLNKPVWGYVGRTSKVEGPWDELHAKQRAVEGRTTTDDDYGYEPKGKVATTIAAMAHGTSDSQREDGHKQQSWQAWELDRDHANQLAENLQQALASAVDTHSIAQEWADIVARQALGPGAAESYVMARAPHIQQAIENVLGPAWEQAWQLGEQAAQHQLAGGT